MQGGLGVFRWKRLLPRKSSSTRADAPLAQLAHSEHNATGSCDVVVPDNRPTSTGTQPASCDTNAPSRVPSDAGFASAIAPVEHTETQHPRPPLRNAVSMAVHSAKRRSRVLDEIEVVEGALDERDTTRPEDSLHGGGSQSRDQALVGTVPFLGRQPSTIEDSPRKRKRLDIDCFHNDSGIPIQALRGHDDTLPSCTSEARGLAAGSCDGRGETRTDGHPCTVGALVYDEVQTEEQLFDTRRCEHDLLYANMGLAFADCDKAAVRLDYGSMNDAISDGCGGPAASLHTQLPYPGDIALEHTANFSSPQFIEPQSDAVALHEHLEQFTASTMSMISSDVPGTTQEEAYDWPQGPLLGHECHGCADTFRTAKDMESHARTTGHRSFKCKKCSFTSLRNDTYDRHIESTHSKKRFPCQYCPEWANENGFARHDTLKKHMLRKHAKEYAQYTQAHVCPFSFCKFSHPSMAFTTLKRCESHVKQYHGQGKLDCPELGCKRAGAQGYTREADLLKHVKSEHPEQADRLFADLQMFRALNGDSDAFPRSWYVSTAVPPIPEAVPGFT